MFTSHYAVLYHRYGSISFHKEETHLKMESYQKRAVQKKRNAAINASNFHMTQFSVIFSRQPSSSSFVRCFSFLALFRCLVIIFNLYVCSPINNIICCFTSVSPYKFLIQLHINKNGDWLSFLTILFSGSSIFLLR